MKLQLDTVKKTIKIEGDVKLTKLISTIKKMFPNGEWQDFTLETNTVIKEWVNPIIYKEYYPQRQWWESPWITYYSTGQTTQTIDNNSLTSGNNITASANAAIGNTTYELKTGTYNVVI